MGKALGVSLGLIGLVILLIGLAFYLSNRQKSQAEASYPPEGQFLNIGDIRVHAVVLGPDTGTVPDLVMIHGSSSSTRDFTFGIAQDLATRYRVILLDRPGMGYSDPLPGGGSILDQARLLQQAAAALGADQPIVLGQSYGGAVALAWAVDRPDRLSALVPVSAPSQPWNGDLPLLYAVNSSWYAPLTTIPLISAFTPDSYVAAQVQSAFDPQPAPPGFAEHFGPELMLRRVSLRSNAVQRAQLLDDITALQPRYGEITVPVEIVHGTADPVVGFGIHSEPLAQQIDGANLTALPGIGHLPQHVATLPVIDAIDRAAARAGLN